MSGTAPNDTAPGDPAAADDGIQQSSLGDANQHERERKRDQGTNYAGGCRNAVDEAKDTNTTTTTTTTHDTLAAAGHHAGEAGDAADGAKHHKGALSGLVDNIVNKALGFGGASEAAERKAEADHHHHHPPGRHP
ncbi:hypothetical protein CH63R_07612 [Colletotrichum higginsianum IMI 349063]|uniref:Uncharacterized protein n=1 Tax=Colletotrichum higginsianum (strain IMI 349063) TaxID=759273 RepID=A0A1B7YA40_COLHI|nr:hypothetical protein CH63R_07612 [Colletotrichum higginsianum IMI 349063]OBR08847.1 hypothetical protein CH63R_07612 [Colletotrichum higginsianum IMI 349063]